VFIVKYLNNQIDLKDYLLEEDLNKKLNLQEVLKVIYLKNILGNVITCLLLKNLINIQKELPKTHN